MPRRRAAEDDVDGDIDVDVGIGVGFVVGDSVFWCLGSTIGFCFPPLLAKPVKPVKNLGPVGKNRAFYHQPAGLHCIFYIIYTMPARYDYVVHHLTA